jgi:serine/threonine protein kinase
MTPKIGKYEVLRKVGTGGRGSVYEAFDPLIRRTVAVKTCEAKDPEVRARFFQEAQLGGSLRHRNITTVYDFGVDDGTPYIVQEFLDGEDLDRIIARREGLSLLEKLRILIGIAYGLEYAHNAGIVHRDVKPGNIRILSDGTVKLMDFGIAKLAQMGRNRTGRNMGTLAYLAPERILEQQVDARADIFSFGVVAYELLAGRRPFEGEIEEELFDRIVTAEPIPLAEIASDVPSAVALIVDRALCKAPEDRYPSIEPMRKALLAAFHSLFGRDAPLTAAADHAGGPASARTDGGRYDVADTRELREAIPEPEQAIASPPAAAGPPVRTPASDAVLAAPERRRGFAPAVLASVVIACAFVGILVWGGSALLRKSPASSTANREISTSRTMPMSPSISQTSTDPPVGFPPPVSVGAAAPEPSAVGEAPHPAGRASEVRTNTSVLRQPAHPGRQASPVGTRIVPNGTSRYARAADEPGLSADTRAAIYLSGAWERYRAGDLPAAREMLASAFALRKELTVDPSQYDAGFRRLADRIRSEGNRSF